MPLTTENLFLEVIDGPEKGRRIKIQEGLRIGRTQGEFKLTDSKISALHGEIVKHKKGVFVLMDRGSTHKIIFDGRKVNRVALLPGIEFVLGSTRLVVKKLNFLVDQLADQLSLESMAPEAPPLLKKIKKFFAKNVIPSFEKKIEFFPYPIQLSWIRGPELGREEVISFGPRKVGSQVNDIFLTDSSAPPVAFEIGLAPDNKNLIMLTTHYPNLVLFNKKSQSQIVFDDVKTIEIGPTEITVNAIKEFISS